MNTPTPTHRAKILRDGIVALTHWLSDELKWLDGHEEDVAVELNRRVSEYWIAAREGKAKDVHKCEKVITCPYCSGHGGVGYEAGDHSGWDDCETCEATGYLPASFEPRPLLSSPLRDESHEFGSDLPLEEERP